MTKAPVEHTTDGMIRNFGLEASANACAVAARFARACDSEGQAFWSAVVDEIGRRGRSRLAATSRDADRSGQTPQP